MNEYYLIILVIIVLVWWFLIRPKEMLTADAVYGPLFQGGMSRMGNAARYLVNHP